MARTTKKEKMLTLEEKLAQALVPETEQPYKVPKNWCWVRLERLYEVNPKNDAADDIEAGFVPMEKVSADMCQSFSYDVQPWIKAKKGHTQFADGDVAFAKISPCFENRKSMVVNGLPNGIGGGTTELIVLRQPMINQQFTFWLISTEDFIQGGCQTYRGVVGQQRISMEYVRNYPIPLPPLAEQQRIIDRIESLFAKLDEAKEKAQSVVDGFENRKAAILHKAFTGELTTEWRKNNGTSINDWKIVITQDVCEKITCGKTPKEFITKEGDIPFLKVYNIVNDEVDFDKEAQFIPIEIHRNMLKSSALRPNDVIMNIVGPPLRKIAIVPERYAEWNMNQAIVRFRPKEMLYYRYLYYELLNPETLDKVIQKTRGVVGQANISVSQARNLEIQLPGISEQREIVSILEETFAKEQQAKKAAEHVIEKIDIMKKSILARAFRGELGTNDPADEPAEELLKRIIC